MYTNNNPPSNNQANNPFISADPAQPTQQQLYPTTFNYQPPMNPNVYYPPAPAPTAPLTYVPPPMYQRAKTQEELDRERRDAEIARAMANGDKSPKTVKEDEEFAKRLVFDESLKTKEQKMLQLLQDEAAAIRLQKEEEALQSIRKRDEERERLDAAEAMRLQAEEESMMKRRREAQETARKDSEAARRLQAEDESLRRLLAEEEEAARRKNAQQVADEELALKFQRDEERRIQEDKDKAVARRIQDEESRAAAEERRRVAEEARRVREEERIRLEAIRREEERIREDERRRMVDRLKVDQILSDAELARRLQDQLNIYVPPPPPLPTPTPYYYNTSNNNNYVNHHTLGIHSQYCGCSKNNQWNNNHIMKIHNKYCNCAHPYSGHYTNAGLVHTHGVGCRLYCKYQNHVHTAECCRKTHVHTQRCHCAAKFT